MKRRKIKSKVIDLMNDFHNLIINHYGKCREQKNGNTICFELVKLTEHLNSKSRRA